MKVKVAGEYYDTDSFGLTFHERRELYEAMTAATTRARSIYLSSVDDHGAREIARELDLVHGLGQFMYYEGEVPVFVVRDVSFDDLPAYRRRDAKRLYKRFCGLYGVLSEPFNQYRDLYKIQRAFEDKNADFIELYEVYQILVSRVVLEGRRCSNPDIG